jgi:hypothetical protein
VPSANFSGVEHLMNEKNGLAAGYDEFLEEKLNEQKEKFSRIVPQKSFLPNVIFFNCI